MQNDVYFFDSYAIIEILRGNENYLRYTKSTILTTKLNLFEVYYCLLREVGENKANHFLKSYSEYVVDFDDSVVKASAKLRFKYKKRKLSMTDCIGYCVAKKWGVPFLTGDREFEDIASVEFVK